MKHPYRLLLPVLLLCGGLLCLGLVSARRRQEKIEMPRVRPTASRLGLFKDVAQSAGIRFVQNIGATGKFYYIESSGSGCAFFDYDNDGYLDILLIQSGPFPRVPGDTSPASHCALYHNNGDGTFTDVTAGSGLDRDLGYGQGVAVGDYDNDGYDDLYITAYGGNHLLHNERGTGKFADVTAKAGVGDTEHGPRYATSAAFGDYDNDGHLDLYVCHYSPWTTKSNVVCRTSHNLPEYCTPDVYDPEVHLLYHNNGDGTFTDVSQQSGIARVKGRGLGVAWLDYDGDGKEDIFVANDMNTQFLWHNDGKGHFTNEASSAGCAFNTDGHVLSGMGVAVGDYDHSGLESLLVCNFSQQPNMLYRNLGKGLFADMSVPSGLAVPHMPFLCYGCEFLDADADGWKDLIIANGHVAVHVAETTEGVTYAERKQFFHNDGNGHFSEITDNLGDLGIPTVSRGLAVGDYDNDGRQDFLVINQNGPVQLFHNENHNGNHWISFKTVGVRSNRDGYHAKLTATCGQQQQYSEVRSGSSYLSHSDSRVYFGLGTSTKVDTLEIRWPSGTREKLRNVAADRCYLLTEGHGITGTLPGVRRSLR